MRAFRLLFAVLVCLSLPVQGYAVATMMLADMRTGGSALAIAPEPAGSGAVTLARSPAAASPLAHDVGSHAGQAGHSAHASSHPEHGGNHDHGVSADTCGGCAICAASPIAPRLPAWSGVRHPPGAFGAPRGIALSWFVEAPERPPRA